MNGAARLAVAGYAVLIAALIASDLGGRLVRWWRG